MCHIPFLNPIFIAFWFHLFPQSMKVKLKQGLKLAMSISSEGNGYLQVWMSHGFFIFLLPSTFAVASAYSWLFGWNPYWHVTYFQWNSVGNWILASLQGKPTFLLPSDEDCGWGCISSCMFIGTFYAIFYSWGRFTLFCLTGLRDLFLKSDCFFEVVLIITLWWELKVFRQLNLPPVVHDSLCDEKGDVDRLKRPWEIVRAGHKIGIPQPLFKELVCHAHWNM